METIRKYFRVGDIIILVSVLLAALILGIVFAGNSNGESFYIKHDGVSETYSLDADRTIEMLSNGMEITVTASNGEVSVVHSDCPDKLCVNTRPISKKGETIVCLPARVVVGISGDYRNEVDGVVG